MGVTVHAIDPPDLGTHLAGMIRQANKSSQVSRTTATIARAVN
jgi:hypothetical protein